MPEKPRRHVLTFLPRFHGLIRDGAKRQTIRGRRKREIRAGDVLTLAKWLDKPYRSKQERLIPDAVCLSVRPAVIEVYPYENIARVTLGGVPLTHFETCGFVRADGFSCVSDFISHWATRPTPRGSEPGRDLVVIEWAPPGDAP